jgi:hypothetical protein
MSAALQSPAHDASTQLDDHLEEIARAGARRRALLLETAKLPSDFSKPHHFRLAREALNPLYGADRARAFDLGEGRIIIIWRPRASNETAPVFAAFDMLLDGVPQGARHVAGEMISLFDLPAQTPWLRDKLRARAPVVETTGSRKLTAPMLASIVDSLQQAELSRFLRWRPVLRLKAGGSERVFDQRFFSVHDIAASLCPDVDLTADPWLFRRLTRSFDRRILTMLTGAARLESTAPFALHLNAATLLSPEFLKFDAELPAPLRGHVVLCLRAGDALADAPGFLFAQKFIAARGYKIMLRHGSAEMAGLIDVAGFGVSYLEMPESELPALTKPLLARLLPCEIVLFGAGGAMLNRAALEAGVSLLSKTA